MHATYSFLLDGVDGNIDAEYITGLFEARYNDRLDDNNWWTALIFVRKDGLLLPLVSADDWSYRERWNDAYKDDEPSTRFDKARKFALQCVATDLSFRGVPPISLGIEPDDPVRDFIKESSFDELLNAMLDEIPDQLATMYAEVNKPKDGEDATDLFRHYRRRKVAEQFEKLFACSGRDEMPGSYVPPFYCGSGSPEDYRCFDLRRGEGELTGILHVDIHT